MTNEDMATEDLILWFQRMMAEHGTHDWNSVKIHMGRMHKGDAYYGMWPESTFSSEHEEHLITQVANKFQEHHAFNTLMASKPIIKRRPPVLPDDYDETFRWL
jgi:hypothetical protein